jgi:hypothetical protein
MTAAEVLGCERSDASPAGEFTAGGTSTEDAAAGAGDAAAPLPDGAAGAGEGAIAPLPDGAGLAFAGIGELITEEGAEGGEPDGGAGATELIADGAAEGILGGRAGADIALGLLEIGGAAGKAGAVNPIVVLIEYPKASDSNEYCSQLTKKKPYIKIEFLEGPLLSQLV